MACHHLLPKLPVGFAYWDGNIPMLGVTVQGLETSLSLSDGGGHFLGVMLAACCKLQCFAVAIFNGSKEPKRVWGMVCP